MADAAASRTALVSAAEKRALHDRIVARVDPDTAGRLARLPSPEHCARRRAAAPSHLTLAVRNALELGTGCILGLGADGAAPRVHVAGDSVVRIGRHADVTAVLSAPIRRPTWV
jgi:hypothetical protein